MEEWSHRFTPICRVFPARTNAFIQSLFPTQTTENATTTDKDTPPPPVPAPDQAQDQVQQISLFMLQDEALDQQPTREPQQPARRKKEAKPVAMNNLLQEADNLMQGQLFSDQHTR